MVGLISIKYTAPFSVRYTGKETDATMAIPITGSVPVNGSGNNDTMNYKVDVVIWLSEQFPFRAIGSCLQLKVLHWNFEILHLIK